MIFKLEVHKSELEKQLEELISKLNVTEQIAESKILNDLNVAAINKNKHRLSDEVERVLLDHLKNYLESNIDSSWQLINSDTKHDVKVFRRELIVNKVVMDTIKAVITVKVNWHFFISFILL